MCLSRATLLQILKGIANLDAALANPQEFASKAVAEIKVKLAAHLIGGIQYHETGEWFDMTIFDGEVEGIKDKMIRSPKGLYDYLVYDSQTECKFVEDLEKRKDVRRYVKLPRLFLVPTPIGDYNPDWAVIADDTNEFGEETGRQLNLVRETKSTLAPGKLRPGEEQKIKCGKKHFTDALGVNFKKITQASELLP
jgi:type III restriction enzyme